MTRLLLLALLAVAPSPSATFDHATAQPGDRVTVRMQGLGRRRQVKVYLVRADDARQIRTRFDPRLAFVGLRQPRRGRATVTFTVPPLETGSYVAWCPGCHARSRSLQVTMPTTCPATTPNRDVPRGAPGTGFHGNGMLAAAIPPTGVFVDDDGAVFNKMTWIARGVSGDLAVRYEPIDATGTPVAAEVVPGTLQGYAGPSWASRMHFTWGCWKVTGRIGAVNLSFVVGVVPP